MSTFINDTLSPEVTATLNGLLAENVDRLTDNAQVKDAIRAMRSSGLTVRETVMMLIGSGAMDAYLNWVDVASAAEPEPEPIIHPVIPTEAKANDVLACVDCGGNDCTYQLCRWDEEHGTGTHEPVPGEGMCQECYFAFTLDTDRTEQEVEELNSTLLKLA